MIKKKKRLIMSMMSLGLMTIGISRIGEIALAGNQISVEELNDDISVESEETSTPVEYFHFQFDKTNKTAEIIAFYGMEADEAGITRVIIPETVIIDSVTYTVTQIENNAFFNCRFLTSIEITDSVTSIGRETFGRCTSLKTVVLSNKLESIGEKAFSECKSLTEIKIPDTVKNIGKFAFNNCTVLISIELPNEIKSIEESTFIRCSQLKTIKIPDSVKSIGNYAFLWCESLETVVLSNKLESIGEGAFEECSKLMSIELPSTLIRIEGGTFYDCSQLATVTIPDTIKSIGEMAFAYCTSLETIVLPNTLEILAGNAFDDSAVNKLIFICQSIDNMKILDGVIGEFDGINIYRMAADNHLKARDDIIKSYEFIGQTMRLDALFRYGVIYEGFIGEEEYTGNDIKLEDYFEMPTTEYTLQGNQTMADTKLIDNILYISQDEKSTDLSVIAESSNGEVLKRPIQIILAESISIKEKPTKSEYDVGNEYKPDGLVITLIYADHQKTDIAYSQENENDFRFTYNQLTFDTKEQEIRYKKDTLEAKHSIKVYGNKTLRDKNVEVKGMFTYESLLEVVNAEIDNDLKDKEIIAGYNINVEGYYKDTLTIVFDVGNEYNRKTLNIRHKGNTIEEFEKKVSEGKVTIEVDNLSPFIIYTEKVVEPDTPDNITPEVPDDSKPVIKPMEPTPDTPVQTIPNQNQPLHNTISTEDKNHFLLWGVLGIVGMSVVIISVKKKSRVKK